MTGLSMDPDEYNALIAVSENMDVMAEMFQTGEESAPALRMVIASLRSAADTLEAVADRWEGR